LLVVDYNLLRSSDSARKLVGEYAGGWFGFFFFFCLAFGGKIFDRYRDPFHGNRVCETLRSPLNGIPTKKPPGHTEGSYYRRSVLSGSTSTTMCLQLRDLASTTPYPSGQGVIRESIYEDNDVQSAARCGCLRLATSHAHTVKSGCLGLATSHGHTPR
jgi:hypothetical protein